MEKCSLAGISISLLSMVPLAPAAPGTGLQIPIDPAGPNDSFAGVFELTRFAVRDDRLFALGTLSGAVTNPAGQVVGAAARTLTLRITDVAGTRDTLHLEVEPIDLTLLGQTVQFGPVAIDIYARSCPAICPGTCPATAAAAAASQPADPNYRSAPAARAAAA